MAEEQRPRPPSHLVAPTHDVDVAMKMDPEMALGTLLDQKTQLQALNNQKDEQLAELMKENAALRKDNEMFEPFREIIVSPRTFHTAYLRDGTLISFLDTKAQIVYGKLADIRSTNSSGRKIAQRCLDNMVEEIIRFAQRYWHLIEPNLRRDPNVTGQEAVPNSQVANAPAPELSHREG